ncbi:EAL domain-containing protein [Synechococcus sp. RSCCF101]|uniref:EAL domain-containing protein n=1 Tax=Synechococcus sp. RSCCF101 TaxID=2511069 RepID=UPI001782AAF2|nr:EAL domain-containing protein [Synechococcus sp. RSCCF101]
MENFHIQPVIDLASNRVCGGEVLWRPDGAPPSPEQQAALEEDPVLNTTITQQAFVFALRQLERPQGGVWLAVNLSCRYVGSGMGFFRPISRMVPDLDTMRRRVGRRLLIEITEKGIAGHEESAFINELAQLHTLAVDDFGIGDGPLSHMLKLDFGKVKVDRSVISGIDADSYRQRFLRWLVAGCHSIGADVCAEGVETESELAFLRRLGINQGQGWLWSKALPPEQFESMALQDQAITFRPDPMAISV